MHEKEISIHYFKNKYEKYLDTTRSIVHKILTVFILYLK